MINFDLNTKYTIDFSSKFKKQVKKMAKQNKDLNKLFDVITMLANKETMDVKYRDHQLIDDKTYKNCRECQITLDWLLIYKYEDENLVLVLLSTGSHSELFV